jgi:hypothetical protein
MLWLDLVINDDGDDDDAISKFELPMWAGSLPPGEGGSNPGFIFFLFLLQGGRNLLAGHALQSISAPSFFRS